MQAPHEQTQAKAQAKALFRVTYDDTHSQWNILNPHGLAFASAMSHEGAQQIANALNAQAEREGMESITHDSA